MLELKELSKRYGSTQALRDVSLTLGPGEIVGLFGENGAGKTTLMKCVLGLLHHQGQVTLDGEAVTRQNIARLSFATCEHSFFPALTPADHRDFYRDMRALINAGFIDKLIDGSRGRGRAVYRLSSRWQQPP